MLASPARSPLNPLGFPTHRLALGPTNGPDPYNASPLGRARPEPVVEVASVCPLTTVGAISCEGLGRLLLDSLVRIG